MPILSFFQELISEKKYQDLPCAIWVLQTSSEASEKQEYERIPSHPFPRIRGEPEWADYINLQTAAAKLATEANTGYPWGNSATGEDYGLIADILGGVEYERITGIPAATYVAATTKPALYDPLMK